LTPKKEQKKSLKVGKHIQIFQVHLNPRLPAAAAHLIASLKSLVPSGSAGHPAWIMWRICWGFFWEKMLGHILGGKLKRCKKIIANHSKRMCCDAEFDEEVFKLSCGGLFSDFWWVDVPFCPILTLNLSSWTQKIGMSEFGDL
jgi:hypothetical protein